jgi:hypothetical protein
MDGMWKVRCWMNSPNSSGSASGEFTTMDEAVEFAMSWMRPGWTGTLTNPSGEQVDLEPGKTPHFPS